MAQYYKVRMEIELTEAVNGKFVHGDDIIFTRIESMNKVMSLQGKYDSKDIIRAVVNALDIVQLTEDDQSVDDYIIVPPSEEE